ncbi:MAG: hypothetical protein HYZ45_04075 [Burkholderiales bacterium]|nr:hypothetical protein [Burkholderiales bacterium]
MRRVSRMLAMTPIDETGHGSGRNYYLPAKVKRNPDGTVTVTEMDGDQFSIGLNGKPTPLNRGGKRGTSPSTVASETYVREVGVERRYYGRGYVQLTWWDNYAAAGVSLGYGLDFVMDPEKVKTPEVAYKIMAFGMLTGGGYANGRRFEHYFYGTTTDYAGARAMVNKNDPQQEIVDNAKLFEAILLRAAIR